MTWFCAAQAKVNMATMTTTSASHAPRYSLLFLSPLLDSAAVTLRNTLWDSSVSHTMMKMMTTVINKKKEIYKINADYRCTPTSESLNQTKFLPRLDYIHLMYLFCLTFVLKVSTFRPSYSSP